jgi:peptide-methionine (R)-S-oxide reductase
MIKLIIPALIFISLNACGQQNSNKSNPQNVPRVGHNIPIDTTWTEKVVKTNKEWKKTLTAKQYYILREHGTERPFSSELYDVKEEGVYVCAGCNNPLFSSAAKFDSGTGWPSYFKAYFARSLNVATDDSHGMVRDALTCKRCDGHLGHVFDDGPEPTGLRFCIDGDGLLFVPNKSK